MRWVGGRVLGWWGVGGLGLRVALGCRLGVEVVGYRV